MEDIKDRYKQAVKQMGTIKEGGKRLRAKDIPREELEYGHREKVLRAKKSFLVSLIFEVAISLVWLIFAIFLIVITPISGVYEQEGLAAAMMIGFMLVLNIVIGFMLARRVPNRIINYAKFDFERTCYAKVAYKYKKQESVNNRTKTRYFANITLSNGDHMLDIDLCGHRNFIDIGIGDRIIVTSFDGYKEKIISLREE